MNKRFTMALMFVLILLGGLGYLIYSGASFGNSTSQLTGLKITAEASERPILGVMIENSEEARPQAGLSDAGIVFESVTEGGLTRFLVLYQENLPSVVGPIRSLRVHFLDWAMGFDASIAHVGGSREALERSEERKTKSLSQFKYKDTYYRDESREAPHNVFAKSNDLLALQKELGHDKSRFASIPRSEDKPSKTPSVKTISVDISSPPYAVEFQYDGTTNSYNRYLAGSVHEDSNNDKPITVKNVIVITMPSDWKPQDGALDEGVATVYKDGSSIEAVWIKQDYQERIKILGSDDKEIQLNRGKTWIVVIESDRTVTVQ